MDISYTTKHFWFYGKQYNFAEPRTEPDDSKDICQAIDFINMKHFQYANSTLNNIISSERNARWYYLSALTNLGLGNTIKAAEQIDRAVQMEPENEEYQNARQHLHRTEHSYNETGQEFQKYAEGMNKVCMGFVANQFFFMFCCR